MASPGIVSSVGGRQWGGKQHEVARMKLDAKEEIRGHLAEGIGKPAITKVAGDMTAATGQFEDVGNGRALKALRVKNVL